MSRAGEYWDNAAMESFYHSLKTELAQFTLGFKTRSEAIKLITEYIAEYYNTVRRHSAIDYQAPFVFELVDHSAQKGDIFNEFSRGNFHGVMTFFAFFS
jgi:transposase InsO family protein